MALVGRSVRRRTWTAVKATPRSPAPRSSRRGELDAHSIAVVAAPTEGLRVLKVEGELEALRIFTDRREALTPLRVLGILGSVRVHGVTTGLGPAKPELWVKFVSVGSASCGEPVLVEQVVEGVLVGQGGTVQWACCRWCRSGGKPSRQESVVDAGEEHGGA